MVREKSIIQTKTRTGYECLKQQKSDNIKKDEYRNFLFAVKEKIVNFRKDELGDSVSTDEYIELYADTKLYRDEFLHLLKYSLYVSEAHKIIQLLWKKYVWRKKVEYEGEVMRTLLDEKYLLLQAYLLNY